MFFLGRKSERDFTPKVTYDMSNSFEAGTRWTSHFHMPTLLSIDIICAKPGLRGLGLLLLAHSCCLQVGAPHAPAPIPPTPSLARSA